MAESQLYPNPMSEVEIQRRHILYQKSFTGNDVVSIRSVSPLRRQTVPKPTMRKQEKSASPRQKSLKQGRDKSPQKRVFKSTEEQLDYRRQSRAERTRPWQETGPKVKRRNSNSVLFYNKILPSNVDEDSIIIKPRRYVSNSKYGDIYELRQLTPKKEEKAPVRTWLWEDEFLLWQKGSRGKYLEDVGNKTKTVLTSTKSIASTFRKNNLPSIKEHPSRPNAEVYATYHHHRLEKRAKKSAALKLQTAFRGWQVRSLLKKLKRKALLEHGRTWLCFVADYRELITRIRSRYGIMKPTCPVDLKQVELFMDTKLRYENVFNQICEKGKLPKDKLMEFFNRCDLWPTQRDINRGFDTVFRGSRNTAEVVFLLDCSSSVGVIGFHNLMKMVRDIVSCLDIAPDRTRVGVVPFNEDVFSSFGITTFTDKKDVLAAICKHNTFINGPRREKRTFGTFQNVWILTNNCASDAVVGQDLDFTAMLHASLKKFHPVMKEELSGQKALIKLRHGLTRTDLALRLTREMFKDSRPGVQKIAIVITDGKSTDPAKTAKEGKLIHEMGVKVFAIGVGEKADMAELELLATSHDMCYFALDLKSLSHIRRQIEQRLCLSACGFCRYLLPRMLKVGINLKETLDLVWTVFPPRAAGIKSIESLQKLPIDISTAHQLIRPSDNDHVCRAIDQPETMDVLWTVYPPEACALHRFKKSRWIRPVVNGVEAWSLLDDEIMRSTGMRACLRLVIKSKLERDGFINIPSTVKEGVEKATNETQVMQIIDKYMRSQTRFAV